MQEAYDWEFILPRRLGNEFYTDSNLSRNCKSLPYRTPLTAPNRFLAEHYKGVLRL
jgi:hypothetical protein